MCDRVTIDVRGDITARVVVVGGLSTNVNVSADTAAVGHPT